MELKRAQLAACIDATTLTFEETVADMERFWERAMGEGVLPAALCIPASWLDWASARLEAVDLSGRVQVATVVNFPDGEAPLAEVVQELQCVIQAGATECDVVFPWRSFEAQPRMDGAAEWLREVRSAAGDTPVKLILETGGGWSASHIAAVADLAVESGMDFLKTSTGKVPTGATDAGWQILLAAAKGRCGVKVSGGVRTWEQAAHYFQRLQDVWGQPEVLPDSRWFRVGTSGWAQANA
jgi:deoxyribose-phosphate aldolase